MNGAVLWISLGSKGALFELKTSLGMTNFSSLASQAIT